MSKLNWNARQSPTDHDDITPSQPSHEFDHRRRTEPGKSSWPEKFGPSVVSKAWKSGLVVVAEVQGLPHPIAVTESRWGAAGVLQVKVSNCWQVPERIWTRATVKGLDSTGLLIEQEKVNATKSYN